MMAPDNHYGLEAKQKLLETLQQEISVYEGKFAPLHEQFALLEKYEKPVPDSVSSLFIVSKICLNFFFRHVLCLLN
jgi:hypothetical protein